MFIDEKRDGEAQEASFTGFRAFVETKDPAEEYNWPDGTACACAQYARSIGKYEEWEAPLTDEVREFWLRLNRLARPALGAPITFGELAQKLSEPA
jgi:hypothetical protein